MAMTLRLDEQHDELLDALAKRFGRSKTEVVEIALDELAAREDSSARTRARSPGSASVTPSCSSVSPGDGVPRSD